MVSDYEVVSVENVINVPCLSVSDTRNSAGVLPAVFEEDNCISFLFLVKSRL